MLVGQHPVLIGLHGRARRRQSSSGLTETGRLWWAWQLSSSNTLPAFLASCACPAAPVSAPAENEEAVSRSVAAASFLRPYRGALSKTWPCNSAPYRFSRIIFSNLEPRTSEV